MSQIIALDAQHYQKHFIHGENRTWAETNCYTDVIIELLHAWGFEPTAALAFTLAADFEGDQWTFFKFTHADLLTLYGLEIQELQPWRSLVHNIEEQIRRGRPVLIELNSYFLPDTAGTAYQLAHVKSTVAVNHIDIAAKRLGYFHNQGYYQLEGSDFEHIFQLNGLVHERMLPPYIEFVKRSPVQHSTRDLAELSLVSLKKQLSLAPKSNPFIAFRQQFEKDLQWLMGENIELFHAYSFATLRQYGSCYELSSTYLRWLQQQTGLDINAAVNAFDTISQSTKAFQFQLARAMARKKALDLNVLDSAINLWQDGMDTLFRATGVQR